MNASPTSPLFDLSRVRRNTSPSSGARPFVGAAAALAARLVIPDYPLAPEHTWRDSHDALADLVVTLVDSVVGTSAVEVELNPVLVGREGAVAVDALWIEEI